MGKPTPLYSAFAIVAIESIWPSSDGDEVPINYQDLVFLNERISGGSEEFKENQDSLIADIDTKKEEIIQKEAAFYKELIGVSTIYTFSRERATAPRTTNENTSATTVTYSATELSLDEGLSSRKKIQLVNSAYLSGNENFLKLLETDVNNENISVTFSNETISDFASYKSAIETQRANLKPLIDSNLNREIRELSREIDSLSREILDTSAYGTYPQSARRPEFSSILTSEDAFKKRRGYFKIIPLNVVQVSTSTSTGGTVGQSSFNISFTMDDVLIVVDKFGASQVENRLPSAVPIKIDEIFDEINLKSFEKTIKKNVLDEINTFGLYSYRISGNDFTFNLEDIIEANDTATVWIYHDPKEFNFVKTSGKPSSSGDAGSSLIVPTSQFNPTDAASVPLSVETDEDASDFDELTLENFVFNKDFSFVLGSGSRKSQDDFKLIEEGEEAGPFRIFKTPPRTLVQDMLGKTGILNPFSTPEALANENLNIDNTSLTNAQVFDFLTEVGRRYNLDTTVTSPDRDFTINNISNRDSIDTRLSLNRAVSSISDVQLMQDNLRSLLLNVYRPNVKRYNNSILQTESLGTPSASGGVNKIKGIPENNNSYQLVSNAIISSVKGVLNAPGAEGLTADKLAENWVDSFGNTSLQNGAFLRNVITREEIKDLFQTIIAYKPTLQQLTTEAVSFLKEQTSNELVTASPTGKNGFFSKRTLLKTNSHGETPYLALKGHVSSVEVKYGASQGSNIVTITGAGYEKILNDNIVYYEDLFSPTGGTFGQAVEAYPIYSQMLPPKAMLSFIEANAPRFILVGKPSRQTIDARNMSLRFARATKAEDFELSDDEDVNEDTTGGEEGTSLVSDKPKTPENVVSKYFDSKTNQALIRGLASIDINVVLREGTPIRSEGQTEGDFQIDEDVGLRIFYPVNYLNTSRIREMINSLEAAYEQNPDEAVIKIPIKISPMQSISNNLLAFNGPKEVNHIFVDETGRLRQRLAYEAWERPPAPEYTPTITDTELLISGSSFSRNSDPVITMVDIRASYLTTAQGIVDARFAGRTLSGGNDYIPLVVINNENFNNSKLLGEDSNFYEVISEPFFRYGMKYRLLNDIYTSSTRVAKRKSILYQGFFSKPLKTAKLALRNNTSYRAGETVLVCLDSYRYRSREVIDVDKTLDWLKYLENNEELIPLYIGVDKRWANHDSYFLTSNLDNSREYSYFLSSFKENPEKFILNNFIKTFELLSTNLKGPLKFITPEYFPTTFWAKDSTFFKTSGNLPSSSGDGSSPSSPIISTVPPEVINPTDASSVSTPKSSSPSEEFYGNLIKKILGDKEAGEKVLKTLRDNPKLFNYVRMQNFKATSYYIEAVQHAYVHGEAATTNLTVSHGQDNLVLLEPFSMKPIGFMSTERRMRIGYDDVVIKADGTPVFENQDKNTRDRLLWENFEDKKLSDLQVTYIEQFKQDKAFKENSFLYTAQKYRNSSNFMYELALELGLDR